MSIPPNVIYSSKDQKSKERNGKIKTVVYISSFLLNSTTNSSSFDFFAEIISNLSNKLYFDDVDLIVKVPHNNQPTQLDILKKVISNKDKYDALIFAPTSILEITKYFEDYGVLEELSNFPLMTIDKYFESNKDEVLIPYVTANWEEGGRKAAERFVVFFKDNIEGGEFVNLLILKGMEGSESRIDGFCDHIKDVNTMYGKKSCIQECDAGNCKDDKCKLRYLISDEIDFTKEGAKSYILNNWYKGAKYSKQDIKGVFSCNDEMALGAREAFQELKVDNIKIIGFDCINEVKRLLQNENEKYMLATIDVKISKQVEDLISNLKSVLDAGDKAKKKWSSMVSCDLINRA